MFRIPIQVSNICFPLMMLSTFWPKLDICSVTFFGISECTCICFPIPLLYLLLGTYVTKYYSNKNTKLLLMIKGRALYKLDLSPWWLHSNGWQKHQQKISKRWQWISQAKFWLESSVAQESIGYSDININNKYKPAYFIWYPLCLKRLHHGSFSSCHLNPCVSIINSN